MLNPTIPTIDPELAAKLRELGMGEQVDKVEKQLGINMTAIKTALDLFVTMDPACVELKRQAYILAVHEDSVLIHGETGTGKELIAQALGINRMNGQFVAVNVSAIPHELVESTLFGVEKGSFTGATASKPGLVQHAGKGTLFLDEIGDLPLEMQAKFLRVIEARKVRRVGAVDEEKVECRFIAASHFNLLDMVKQGKFRLDLYARLSTFILTIPPLRERLADIPKILATMDPKFPVDKVDWAKADLALNVRSLQQYVRRWALLNRLPA